MNGRVVRRGATVAAGALVLATVGHLFFGAPTARQYARSQAYEIAATQDIKYRVGDRPAHELDVVLEYIHTWMRRPAHRGDGYQIRLSPGGEWSRKRTLNESLSALHDRLQAAKVDDQWVIRSVASGFHMWTLKVDANPAKVIDTEGTRAIDIIVGTTVYRFPTLSTAGIYVCKYIAGSYTLSQHSYANAVDWVGPEATLNAAANYQLGLVKQGYLPASQILWRGRNIISGSSVSDHYSHIHDSGSPLLSGSSCRRAA